MSRVFVATSAPAGWPLGRWSQVNATMWEERKLQNPKTAYQFEVVSGPDGGASATVRLKLRGQSTEVLLTEMTAQIFVDGSYFGEYIGQWQMQNGAPAPAPAYEQAPPPVANRGRGPPMDQPPGAPFGQKAGPPPRDDYGAPQKAAPPPGAYGAPPAPARNDYGPPPGGPAGAQKAAPPGAFGAQKAAPQGAPYAAPAAAAPMMPQGAPPRPQKQGFDRDPKSVQRLCDAARAGDVGSVNSLLQSVDPDAPARDGKTALLIAAGMGNLQVVQALLDAGADPNVGKDGNTPLTAAFQKGNQEVLRVLFQASFASLDSAVLPQATDDFVYRQASAYGDDEVPETAIMELREVTAKLASMSAIPQAPPTYGGKDEWLPQSDDGDMMRQEAIKEAMRSLTQTSKLPGT